VKTAWWLGLSVSAVAVCGIACSAASATAPGNDTNHLGAGSGGDGNLFNNGAATGAGGGGIMFGQAGTTTTTMNPDGTCTGVSQKAEKTSGKADVVIAVDNSGSMTQEATAVQQKLNSFSSFIQGTGIDVHVVLLSERPHPALIPGIINLINGICVDPPLGMAGACPDGDDTNFAAGYMHWVVMVNSNDVLSVIQSSYNGWHGMLRPDSTKTFVVVSDDEVKGAPAQADFVTWVNGLPEFKGSVWRYSGVFCVPGAPPSGNCSAIGTTHAALVTQTGGVSADLGVPNPDWDAVFKQIGDAVVKDARPVDCQWTIPPPPDGQKLDPAKVNVTFTPSSGVPETLYALSASTECTDATGGWFYDNAAAPRQVLACPSSCTKMQADVNAKVDVGFGCDSKRLLR
jgi:hypothetical protein